MSIHSDLADSSMVSKRSPNFPNYLPLGQCYSEITFEIREKLIKLELERKEDCKEKKTELYYENVKNRCFVSHKGGEDPIGRNYIRKAISDMAKILEDPSVVVEHLRLEHENLEKDFKTFMLHFREIFGGFKHQLHVENLSLGLELDEHDLIGILSLLKPGVLHTVLITKPKEKFEGKKKVMDLEQWKQLQSIVFFGDEAFSVPAFVHCPDVHAGFGYNVSLDDLNMILEGALRQGTAFKEFYIYCSLKLKDWEKFSEKYDAVAIKQKEWHHFHVATPSSKDHCICVVYSHDLHSPRSRFLNLRLESNQTPQCVFLKRNLIL